MNSSLTGVRLPVRRLRAARDGAADLEQAVAATACPAVGNPVIMLEQSARGREFDGEPAFGQVANLRVTDGALTGDLVSMPAWLRDQVAAGAASEAVTQRNVKCSIGHRHPLVVAALVVDAQGVGPIRNYDDLRQLVAASAGHGPGGEQMDAQQAINAQRLIMAAVGRGAISARRALQAARDAADGDDISFIAALAGVRSFAAASREVPDLPALVMEVLAGGQVSAHSHQQALQNAHQALDTGHGALYLSEAEKSRQSMFPPRSPLGPPEDDEDEDDTGMTGPGHFAPALKRRVIDQQKRASAHNPSDEADQFEALYGYRAPRGYFDEPGRMSETRASAISADLRREQRR